MCRPNGKKLSRKNVKKKKRISTILIVERKILKRRGERKGNFEQKKSRLIYQMK